MQGYQRLEFLGDAVLDLLMTRFYFTTYRSVTALTVAVMTHSNSHNYTRVIVITVKAMVVTIMKMIMITVC